MRNVLQKDLGLIDYMECWALQKKFFEGLIAAKTGREGQDAGGEGNGENRQDAWGIESHSVVTEGKDKRIDRDETGGKAQQVLLLCEHPHVYTLGKSGRENNLLIDPAFMRRIGASYHKVDRGGDITYHGPGQLVGYPILDLDRLGIGLKDYVHGLEEAIIATVKRFGIMAGRSEGATGVWVWPSNASPHTHKEQENKITPCDGNDRKIAAIGVRSSRFVTMHGFSLNVSPAMEYFSYINPCGFTDRGVTSIAAELGRAVEMDEVKKAFTEEFGKVFGVDIVFLQKPLLRENVKK